MVQRIEAQARDHGNRVALVQYTNRMRYADLNRAANGVARSPDGHAGTIVPICMKPGLARIIAALGVLKAGRAYAPIDPGLHDAGLREQVQHTQGMVVRTDAVMAHRLAVTRDGPHSINVQEAMHDGTDEKPPCRATPGDLAYLRYTSGSTGTPIEARPSWPIRSAAASTLSQATVSHCSGRIAIHSCLVFWRSVPKSIC